MHDERDDSETKAETAFFAYFMPLEVPAPPGFEEALGCEPGLAYIGVHWDEAGDIVYNNGFYECPVGEGWNAWSRHPAVALPLARLQLGNFNPNDDSRALLLEAATQALYSGDREAVRTFLRRWYLSRCKPRTSCRTP